MDMAIIYSMPSDYLLYILGSIAVFAAKRGASVIKDFAYWQRTADKLWKNHFPEFVEYETQHLVGTRKQRKLLDFTKLAAANVILPTWKELLRRFVGRSITENIVTEIEMKKNANHIIHGNPVVSDISEMAIFQYEHAIDFGYIEGDKAVYEVQKTDYLDASTIEVSSKEWIIVDKGEKKNLVTPIRKEDGTYRVDGAIVIRCEDPYCIPDNGGVRTALLGFWGTHAPGSYASNALVSVPEYMEKLEKALHQENIHDDPFIAAVEIKFDPYPFGAPPADEKIVDIEIKRVEKLTKKRI